MSFDIIVYVKRIVDRAGLDAALADLGAPCVSPNDPRQFNGYVPVELALPGMEGELAGGFEGYFSEAGGAGEGEEDSRPPGTVATYSLALHADDDESAAWTIATAIARAGGGVVVDPQEGKTYGPRSLKSLESRIVRWRKRVESAYARLSAKERAFRQRRPGESPEAHRERLWLRRAAPDELAAFIKERLAAALSQGDDAAIERIVELVPKKPSFIEPSLDPCARAGRIDVGRRIAARFAKADLRRHFIEAAGWVGIGAVPYARFLADLDGIAEDAEILAAARAAASSPEMKEMLASRA